LSPSSVSNNVKETYGVPPGSSRFLAYVKLLQCGSQIGLCL